MKAKQAIILVLILAVLAGATALTLRLKQPSGEGLLGRTLLEDLPWQDIAAVSIRGLEGSVGLAERDGRWVVLEREGYPADFSRIAALVKDVREAKIGRVFEPDQETLGRLGLKDPEDHAVQAAEAATLLTLMNAEGERLVEMALGTDKPSNQGAAAGRYVRLNRLPGVYRVDRSLAVSCRPADWLDKLILKVAPADISEIVCREAGVGRVRYRLKRNAPEQSLTLENLPERYVLDPEKLRRLSDAVSSLQMLDLEGPRRSEGSDGGSFPVVIAYRLFNGVVYRIYPGAACVDEKGCPLRVAVAWEPQEKDAPDDEAAASAAETASEGDAPGEDPSARAAAEAARLEERTFLVPEWQHQHFVLQVEDLLVALDEEPDYGHGQGPGRR
ncbi:DUF4340 domain-containing protein [Desulfatiglans anilini]|uniref:DUF4340 domain-containing protein n=1 Tax=Desulfatiglans anilini TaxID=90728 RepID=UPI00040523DA|nr:DUF4340 domain-containing protein [Desulfatiglans anilini]